MSATLLLNSDAGPVSWLPLSVITWQDAIKYLVIDKAIVLEWHEDWVVCSARWETRVPAVMILRDYQKKKSSVRFSKQNVFLRDGYECQYCGKMVNRRTATLDHVLPISHGGKSVWENCTTACGSCNSRKGNNYKILPEVKPVKPNYYALVDKRKKIGWEGLNPSWQNYLE